jgi:hypothetical protein
MGDGTRYLLMGLVLGHGQVTLVWLMTRTYYLARWFNKTIKLIAKMN